MVERRPILTFVSHLTLLIGVAIVVFPVFLTLVGSTQTAEQIATANPISLMPGGHMLETYQLALLGGKTSTGSTIGAVLPMMWFSLVTAVLIAVGKIAISLLSAFAILYFRFPFKNLVVWMIFVTLLLPSEVRMFPHD